MSKILVATGLLVGVYGQTIDRAAATTNDSVWFRSSAPTVENHSDRTPLSRSDYNTDCTPETGVIRPAGFTPPLATPVAEQTIDGCSVRGSSGRYMNGYFKLDGTHQYASLSQVIRPIPGSSSALRLFNIGGKAANVSVIDNFALQLDPQKLSDGKLNYNLKPHNFTDIRDQTGALLNFDPSSIGFSHSGEWLAASSFQGLVRYHLPTHKLLLFDFPFNYSSAINPLIQTSVTRDGRYAVFGSGPHSRLRVYDLSDCETVNLPTLGRRTCTYRELYGLLPAKTGSHVALQELRLIGDYALRVYRREQFTSHTTSSQYTIIAPGEQLPNFQYLALGDSYTAGNGAYNYKPGTDDGINSCRVSEFSYPYLIRQDLDWQQAESVACSGAITWDINNDDPNYPGQAKDLLKFHGRLLSPIIQLFKPGQIPQKLFVEHYQPNIITVSVGGNDIGFGDKLLDCVMPKTCYDSFEDRLEIFNEIAANLNLFTDTYLSVKRSARPYSHIYAIGYPQVAKADGECGNNVLLDPAELDLASSIISILNQTLQQAARKAGVSYIDIEKAFEGHRLCETVYSNIAVNGLAAGDDAPDIKNIKGPLAGESYHPNQLGHRLYRDTILKQTNRFAASSPLGSIPAPSPESVTVGRSKNGRQISKLQHVSNIAPSAVRGDQKLPVNLAGGDHAIAPNTNYTITFGDRAISASSDSSGNLSATINPTENNQSGFFKLTARTTNIVGEPITFYKTVQVYEEEDKQNVSTSAAATNLNMPDPTAPVAVLRQAESQLSASNQERPTPGQATILGHQLPGLTNVFGLIPLALSPPDPATINPQDNLKPWFLLLPATLVLVLICTLIKRRKQKKPG